MKDLYFKCPECKKNLVIGREAAGYQAPCPECGKEITIPTRSSLPPNFARSALHVTADLVLVALLTFVGLHILGRNALPVITPSKDWAMLKAQQEQALATATQQVAEAEQRYRQKEKALEAEKQKIEDQNQKITAQFEGMANWVLTTFGGKYPLAEKFVSSLNMPAVNDDYSLNADVAEVLQISPQEKTMVDDALGTTYDTMTQLEAKLLTVKQSSPDKVTLYVPPYAKDGAAVREDLYAALETTLGPQRFDRFVDITSEKLADSYHYFGTASRTMIFEMTYPSDPNEKPYVVIKDGWIVPNGDSSRSVNVKESAVHEIPDTYVVYSAWLPDTMAAYFKK